MEFQNDSGGMDLAIEAPAGASFAGGAAADADLAAAILLELARTAIARTPDAAVASAFPPPRQPQLSLAL